MIHMQVLVRTEYGVVRGTWYLVLTSKDTARALVINIETIGRCHTEVVLASREDQY